MNTISINPQLYDEALKYASSESMSVSTLFELAVRKFITVRQTKSPHRILDRTEYQKALDYMDALMSDTVHVDVPFGEDGREARTEKHLK